MTFRACSYWLMICIFSLLSNSRFITTHYSATQHARLHLPKTPKTFYFHDHTIIDFQSEQAYDNVIKKWQGKLTAASLKLFNQLETELDLSPSEIYEYTTNQQVLSRYHILNKSEIALPNSDGIITEDNMDPEILCFLQSIFFKYTNKRNVTFFLIDQLPSLTATYGSDVHGHFVFCHSYMYNKQHIQQYYESLQNQSGYYYIESCDQNNMRWIEIPTMLQIGLIEAASHAQHQKNLIGFILRNYAFQGKRASEESINLYLKLETFHCLLEAVFQSRNPLEVAVFLMKANHKSPDYKILWRGIVKDIAKSYDASSLETTKLFAKKMKQAATQ